MTLSDVALSMASVALPAWAFLCMLYCLSENWAWRCKHGMWYVWLQGLLPEIRLCSCAFRRGLRTLWPDLFIDCADCSELGGGSIVLIVTVVIHSEWLLIEEGGGRRRGREGEQESLGPGLTEAWLVSCDLCRVGSGPSATAWKERVSRQEEAGPQATNAPFFAVARSSNFGRQQACRLRMGPSFRSQQQCWRLIRRAPSWRGSANRSAQRTTGAGITGALAALLWQA